MTPDAELEQIIDDLVQCSDDHTIVAATFYAEQHTLPALQAREKRLVIEAKIELISWCLSRTSMEELKNRWRELEAELKAQSGGEE